MKFRRTIAALALAAVLSGGAFAQQRPDAEIQAELQRRIGSGTGVTIAVGKGVATLTGMAPSLAQRLSIINVARRTIGVREVVDRVTVVPAQKRSDEQIARSVREILAGNLSKEELAATTIRVENGVVVLTGTLPSSYPKQLARTLASLAPGAVDIRNEIVVRPPVSRSGADILSDVEGRYARNPFISTSPIKVAVESGVVTLTGTVDSFLQAEQAESVARFVPGVIDVRNLLFVRAGD